ncbi:hypothetical protein NMG60_11018620 [Bertholletia excelsa]
MTENKSVAVSDDFVQEFEDDLSLCNLPIQGYDHQDCSPRPSTSSDRDLFEFFGSFGSDLRQNDVAVFCGKIIDDQTHDGEEMNEYRKRDYFSLKSASFHKPSPYYADGAQGRKPRSVTRTLSSSVWSPVQKVNITSITSMSQKSRRRMFMFGPVKFKPEMDVVAIRKRQGRRPPLQISPLPEDAEALVCRGGRWRSGGESGGEAWGLLRALWCRSRLAAALAKSFGCISASMVK